MNALEKAKAALAEYQGKHLTLSARQLRAALDYGAPDFDTDEDQRDTEICLQWLPERQSVDGETMEAGLYMWDAEYPEEGVILLDEKYQPDAATVAPQASHPVSAELTDERILDEAIAHAGHANPRDDEWAFDGAQLIKFSRSLLATSGQAGQSEAARNAALEEAARKLENTYFGCSDWLRLREFTATIRALATQAPVEPDVCGCCHGTGWMVRDADIGTDQECFACDGTGKAEQEQPAPVNVPTAEEYNEQQRAAVSGGWLNGWNACRKYVLDNASVSGGEDARDAARYRWLRQNLYQISFYRDTHFIDHSPTAFSNTGEYWDNVVDAAIAARKESCNA